ncbi:alpha/beta fold hydrolase [Lactiplantibacillus plantarum]
MAEAMPVLYVCAAQSPYFPIGYGPWLEEHNRCVRAVVLQSCGHDIMAEVPEAFDQTLHDIFSCNTLERSAMKPEEIGATRYP